MIHKISLAALFCLTPIAMSESATAAHGCGHSAPMATAYRAPVGHFHSSHQVYPRAVRQPASYGAFRPAPGYSDYRYGGSGVYRSPYSGSGFYRSPYSGFARPAYGGGFQGGSPFGRAPLNLSIGVGGMRGMSGFGMPGIGVGPRFGW